MFFILKYFFIIKIIYTKSYNIMNTNNSSQEEQVPFFSRTLFGIQYWIYALVIIILLIWWAHHAGYFRGFETGETMETTSFAHKTNLQPVVVSPVESRIPGMTR